jgi:iron complex outermembrane receptor protein
MKHAVAFLVMLLVAQTLLGQTNSRIRVIEKDSRLPVAGAIINYDGSSPFVTDATGTATFKSGKKGNLQLQISAAGYKSINKTISIINLSNHFEIELEKSEYFLEPVEITAQRASFRSPFSKTDLSKKDIEKRNIGQDLPFILNHTPSVVVTSDAGNSIGYTGIRIRGSDASRINMTINGIPYNDAESQGVFFVNLPDLASSVNSIQIQRGVGTSVNGAGAFGATMNFSTNEFQEKAYAEVNNSVGSFNTWKHTVKAGTGLINNRFTLDTRLSMINSDGFIDRARTDLRSFYLSGAYLGKKTTMRLNIISGKEKTYQAWNGIPEAKLRGDNAGLLTHYYNNIGSLYFTQADSVNLFSSDPRRFNVYTYANQTDNYQQDHFQFFLNHQFNKNLTGNITLFYSKGAGYYEQFRNNNRFSSYGLPNVTVGTTVVRRTDLIRQLWLDNNFYGGLYSLHLKKKKHQLIAGGGYSEYRGDHFGEIIWAAIGIPNNFRWYDFNAVKRDGNIYAKWEYAITPALELFTDLQYRNVNYNFTGTRKFPTVVVNEQFHFLNPKLGLSYRRNGYTSYVSYAVGNKEPNRDDYERNSNEPKPKREQLHNVEAGITRNTGKYSWNANLYYMRYRDQLVLTGRINDVGDAVRVNVPNSYRLGLELQGTYRISQSLNIEANLTWSRNQILNFTDAVPNYDNNFDLVSQDSTFYRNTTMSFSPEWVGSANINWLPFKKTEISLITKGVSDQFMDNTENKNRMLKGYVVQDLRITRSIESALFKNMDIALQINNIWNKKYEANGYTYSYIFAGQTTTENFFFPMAGTNISASVNIRF